MIKYCILLNPQYERVCFENSHKLAVLETKCMDVQCINELQFENICGVDYLTFKCENELNSEEFEKLSKLAYVFAIFKMQEGMFIPLEKGFTPYLSQSLSAMMKYTGKTNELFTRLMLNMAYNELEVKPKQRNVRLLDPVAGKGTTLFEGLSFGFDSYGIEVGEKQNLESFNFLKKYLEVEKLKHSPKKEKVSGVSKTFIAKKYTLTIYKDKNSEERSRIFQTIGVNSKAVSKLFAKDYFDLIVGDLPYGIQHGNVTNEKQSKLTRSPELLLKQCLWSWVKVLKVGGVVALSWNTHMLERGKIAEIMNANGLEVIDKAPWSRLAHRVDSSIRRDIIIARKLPELTVVEE